MKRTFKLAGIIILVLCFFTGCNNFFINPEDLNIESGADINSMKVSREDNGPVQGGALNLFMYKPDTLNPLTSKNKTVRHLSFFIFDTLFYESHDGMLKNGLVKNFTASQDNLIYDIELKDNVLFHDGESLTADDVAFTINAIHSAGNKSIYENNVLNIESVKSINRLSFRIILEKSDAELAMKLTFPIVPEHIFKNWPIEGHNEKMTLVGTGPFIFNSYHEDVINLKRNDSYWNVNLGLKHPIWLDGITFNVYSNESDMMEAFQKKEIDIACIEEGDMRVYSKRSDIFYNEYENNIIEFLALSPVGTKNSPMAKEEFRKAILEYLCWYSEENPLYENEVILNAIYSFNSDQNKTDRKSTIEALIEEGFTYHDEDNILSIKRNGIDYPVTISIIYNGINDNRLIFSKWITNALQNIGVQVNVTTASYEEQQQITASGEYDMILLGCRIPLSTKLSDLPKLIKDSLNLTGHNNVILPLYRQSGAVLYQDHIRGIRKPIWQNIYNGWQEWYIPQIGE